MRRKMVLWLDAAQAQRRVAWRVNTAMSTSSAMIEARDRFHDNIVQTRHGRLINVLRCVVVCCDIPPSAPPLRFNMECQI